MFATVRPTIYSTAQIPRSDCLTLVISVNRVDRQRSGIIKLISNFQDMIKFEARGYILEHETVIITSTPSGVVTFMQLPV